MPDPAQTPSSEIAALFAAPPAVAAHPAAHAAARIAAETLAPHAAAADDPDRGVDPAHLSELVAAGLLSVTVPVAEGGHGAGALVDAEVVEQLSGGCGATWFVATQHRSPQAFARGVLPGMDPAAATHGPAAARHRADLDTARWQAGIAIAHVRRPGPPAVRAEPEGTGWRLHGAADWCTGWGLLDVVMIAAAAPGERFLLALLPARAQPGLRASDPLPLSVMGGTRTVALQLDGLRVPASDVLAVVDAAAWRAHDAARTTNPTPATFGLLRRMLVALAEVGATRGRPEAVELAHRLAPRARACRDEAYALLTEVSTFERVAERVALRGEVAELSVRTAHALIAARSGSALLRTSPEQRWAREAGFHLIQAQTATVRAAQLAAFGHAGVGGTS